MKLGMKNAANLQTQESQDQGENTTALNTPECRIEVRAEHTQESEECLHSTSELAGRPTSNGCFNDSTCIAKNVIIWKRWNVKNPPALLARFAIK
jgi:hypothetical protein